MKSTSPKLVELRLSETLKSFPIIRLRGYKIVGRPNKIDDFPILITQYQILSSPERIIGIPISYKAYQANCFHNPNGASILEEIDIIGIDEMMIS